MMEKLGGSDFVFIDITLLTNEVNGKASYSTPTSGEEGSVMR